jgi:hypothetical protein
MVDDVRSGRLVAWGNAWFAGLASPDEVAARVCGTDPPHRVVGLPGEPAPVALSVTLGRLRTLGVTGLRLALPAPGDPLGLAGPPEFNEAAVEAGEAVLALGGERTWGLLPRVRGYGPRGDRGHEVLWQVQSVATPRSTGLSDLPEAEHRLTEALRLATEEMARLDLSATRAADTALAAIRGPLATDSGLAPGYPARAHRVLALAGRLGAIARLATDDGAALSNHEVRAQRDALRPLERASRHARMAAYNAAHEAGGRY